MGEAVKLGLSITHAAHRPERVATFNRLMEQLMPSDAERPESVQYHVEAERMPHWQWSQRQWAWAAFSPGISHGLFLQDDVIVCDRFIDVAQKIVEANPLAIIAFHTNHGAAREIQKQGLHWYTSADGLVGNGYVLPVELLRELLVFREEVFETEVMQSINEDTLIDLFAMATGRRIWHTVPSPIDHDTSVPSTWGADHHAMRRPQVLPVPEMWTIDWTVPERVPHVGRVYRGNHWRLITETKPAVWKDMGLIPRAYALSREAWG